MAEELQEPAPVLMTLNLCLTDKAMNNEFAKQNVLLYNIDVVQKVKTTDVFHSIGSKYLMYSKLTKSKSKTVREKNLVTQCAPFL